MAVATMVHNVEAWTYHYRTDKNMDWEKARRWCQQQYTDMVAIQNQDEIAYLNNTLPAHRQYYWIGIRKVDKQWTWVGTKKPLTDEASNWATGEPNNHGSGEDCVEIYIKRGKDTAKWNDERCSKQKAPLCYTASCFETSCSEHAECVENIGSYFCKCDPGFTGPRCEEAVECGLLRKPVQGFLQCNHVYGEFRFNSSCHFHCERGYVLNGSQSLHCQDSGNWNTDTPECQVVQCPSITVAAAELSMNCSHPIDTNSYNSTCTFSCKEGFEMVGSLATHCDYTGQWTHKAPTCTVVSCGTLLTPAKGHMICADPLGKFSFHSSCTVSCERGYTLRGENTVTCLKTGNWSADAPTCEAVSCGPLLTPENSHMTCAHPLGNFSFRSSCVVTCEDGYTLRGENTLTCLETGNWSADTPVCTARQCPLLFTPEKGGMNCSHLHSSFSFGSRCSFWCENGYVLTGESALECTAAGSWSQPVPSCKAVSCGALLTPENGHMTCAHPLGNFSFHSSCVVTCEDGYTLRGENTLTCLETGNWSADTPVCTARQCPLLFTPEKGGMNCSHLHSSFSFGSRCSFWCENGYVLTGESALECTAAGSWSQPVPSCKARQCPLLFTPEKGGMNCSHLHSSFSFGSRCSFWCESGYVLTGESALECTAAGSWSQPVPSCKARQCPLLFTPEKGGMNCSHLHSSFSFGSRCSFWCENGYVLTGESALECTAAGSWSHPVSSCKAKEMPLGTSLLMYTAIGAGSSLGLLMVGWLFLLVVRQFTKKAKFTPDNSPWEGDLNPAFEDI
ncbi:hypothetical protein NFI96_000103 [Prochilodus magdalenae]|nr:hypothetical protein NFI96_000103 [Prochilodus magdalenae]